MVSALVAGLWIIKANSLRTSSPTPENLCLHTCQCMHWVSAIRQMSWNVPGWAMLSSTVLCLHEMQGTLVSMFLQRQILCQHLAQQKSGFRTCTSMMTRLSRTMDRFHLTAIVFAVRVTQLHTCTTFSKSMIVFFLDWRLFIILDS